MTGTLCYYCFVDDDVAVFIAIRIMRGTRLWRENGRTSFNCYCKCRGESAVLGGSLASLDSALAILSGASAVVIGSLASISVSLTRNDSALAVNGVSLRGWSL